MENLKPVQNFDNSMVNFYVNISHLQKSLTHDQFCFIYILSSLPSLGDIQTFYFIDSLKWIEIVKKITIKLELSLV